MLDTASNPYNGFLCRCTLLANFLTGSVSDQVAEAAVAEACSRVWRDEAVETR